MGNQSYLEGIYNYDINTAILLTEDLKDGSPLNIAGYPDNRMIILPDFKQLNKYYQLVEMQRSCYNYHRNR
jgi:hypothetical protein